MALISDDLLGIDLMMVTDRVGGSPADTASKQGPMEAVQKSVRLFEEKRYREMRRRNIIGQVCDTPKSYDNVMHVGLRKVTFKWQRGNKIGKETKEHDTFAPVDTAVAMLLRRKTRVVASLTCAAGAACLSQGFGVYLGLLREA